MVRRKEECKVEYREKMRGGEGTAIAVSLISGPEELNGKGRLFSHIRLNPGSSIGYHVHEGDTELFYFLKGTGIYCDNGTDVKVGPGDVAICETGHGHGVVNTGEGLLEMIAVIVYA
jgi:mannose-6-phosphate isomerase-like protein (cupin superfamily)